MCGNAFVKLILVGLCIGTKGVGEGGGGGSGNHLPPHFQKTVYITSMNKQNHNQLHTCIVNVLIENSVKGRVKDLTSG